MALAVGLALIFFSAFLSPVHSEPQKVVIFPGDNHSKTAIEAIKEIESIYPELKEKVCFRVLSSLEVRKNPDSLKEIASSRIVFFFLMVDRRTIELTRPFIAEMTRQGGRTYGIGATYLREHKEMGIIDDLAIKTYFKENGLENIKNMILFALQRDLGLSVAYEDPAPVPDFGIYLKHEKSVVESNDEFLRRYSVQPRRPWIGITFSKSQIDSNNAQHIDSLIDHLEREGYNVLPVYGHPSESAVERFFFDENGKSRVNVVIGLSLKIGLNPQIAGPLLSRLNVPVIDAITLYTQTREEWERSPVGLDIFERAWQVAMPEMGGIIQPTVIASKEKVVDGETGMEYIEERPIPERIKRLVARVKAWLNLQEKPNKDKRIAVIYYNYPPGKQNIGASYLNVLPESLYEILNKLKQGGYETGSKEISKEQLFIDIQRSARNIGNWASGELDRLVKTGKPILIPMATYKRWFEELPEGLRKAVIKNWGGPEESNIMIWIGEGGKRYIVIPAVLYGHLLFTPQPSRGWEQDVKKLYHDVTLAPHHQYLAFYLWLKNWFKVDAVVHVGRHGTHEWLSGKEVGFTDSDPPESLIQDLPNIYPYIVDGVGEGLQAKRRGMAVIIDHMTPPFDQAGMNKELKELSGLLNDYQVARGKSPSLVQAKLDEINRLAKRTGILTDLKLKEITGDDDIEELEDYLKDISERQTPFGLHTFGRAPEERYRKTTAEAILSIEKNLSVEEKQKRLIDLEERILKSAQRELDSLTAALSGRYIPAGQGNDPILNPEALPTGKNFYAFDPTRIPSRGNYEMGARLARELIEGYKQKHGVYPDKLTFNLWGVETIRHEGIMDSQIMYLMGIRPRWDARGRVIGVEAISRAELGRPRIDVTMIPSGLYRDLFPNLMALLDQAVTLAKDQTEEDNLIRQNVIKTKKRLIEKGMDGERAEKLAAVRLFTVPPGAYGTNLDKVISLSNTWDHERQVADVYFMRMSHLYGQGLWGEKIHHQGDSSAAKEDISLDLLKQALSGTKIAVHSRSGNVYATLDNDDFFQYLGGTAMAIRVLDGKTPEVYVTDLSNPKRPKQESLEKFMGREMRARYLNPEWIKAMMKEGYAGARFVDKVVEHLWGWQVTVPEAVDAAKWNEMYETYVLDRNGLNLKELFRQSKNMWAYQSIVARMLETVRKDYWKPEQKVIETLAKEYVESVKEVGLACCDHTCNNPLLTKFTSSVLMSVPGLKSEVQELMKALDVIRRPEVRGQRQGIKAQGPPLPVREIIPDGRKKIVEGFEMKDVTTREGTSAPIPYLFLIGFLGLIGLIALGWRRKTR